MQIYEAQTDYGKQYIIASDFKDAYNTSKDLITEEESCISLTRKADWHNLTISQNIIDGLQYND